MVCGIGRVGGLYAGFVANDLALQDHPVHGGAKRPGGILYREGIAKISQFSRACDDDGCCKPCGDVHAASRLPAAIPVET